MILVTYTEFHQPLEPDRLDHYLRRLPLDFQQKSLRYQRWQDTHAAVFGRTLLMDAFNKLGLEKKLDDVFLNEFGRPAIDGLDFNISHSDAFIVCVVTSSGCIGVDVEKLRHFDWQRFPMISQVPITSSDTFLQEWTMREAVLKAEGVGLSRPMYEVHIDSESMTATFNGSLFHLKRFYLPGEHLVCLAMKGHAPNDYLVEGVSYHHNSLNHELLR